MIQLERDGDLWVVTLDRADKANSVTEAMLEQLIEIADQAQAARGLILTGVGRVFSAGADLDEVAEKGLATSPLWERLSQAIADLPGLTVAALNGTLEVGAERIDGDRLGVAVDGVCGALQAFEEHVGECAVAFLLEFPGALVCAGGLEGGEA